MELYVDWGVLYAGLGLFTREFELEELDATPPLSRRSCWNDEEGGCGVKCRPLAGSCCLVASNGKETVGEDCC